MKQTDCARALGKHRYTVIRIEKGKIDEVSVDTVLAYADLLDVPHDAVFPNRETT